MPEHLTAIIADDHDDFRETLRDYLMNHIDIAVIAESKDGIEALRTALTLKADLAIFDIRMPYLSGIEVCNIIRQKMVNIKVLLYSFDSSVLEPASRVADRVSPKETIFDVLKEFCRGIGK